MAVADAGPGDWLAIAKDGELRQLIIRRARGAASPIIFIPGSGRLAETEAAGLEVIAKSKTPSEGNK